MRSLLVFSALILGCSPPEPAPHRNLAIVTAKMLNLPNLQCEELATGWGFTPDTAICQAAEKNGEIRMPTMVLWCAAGAVGEPTCKTVYDLRVKK